MREHLSALELDTAEAVLPLSAQAQGHLEGCASCREALESRKAASAVVRSSVEFARTRARVESTLAAPSPSHRWRWVVAMVALGGVVAVVATREGPAPEETRLKGGVAVRVLRARDGQPTTRVSVGERVVLAVSRRSHRYAVVFEQGSDGVNVVWPGPGGSQALDAPGSEVRLEPGFEVAPGSVTLHAFFGDGPLDVEGVRAKLLDGEAPSHAEVRLEVVP